MAFLGFLFLWNGLLIKTSPLWLWDSLTSSVVLAQPHRVSPYECTAYFSRVRFSRSLKLILCLPPSSPGLCPINIDASAIPTPICFFSCFFPGPCNAVQKVPPDWSPGRSQNSSHLFPFSKDHSLALLSNIWKELLLIFCPVLWLLCWEVNFQSCYSLMAGSLNQRPKSKGSRQSTGARTMPSKSLDLFQPLWRLRALTRTKTLSHSLSSTNLSEVAWIIPISHETEV